MVIRLQGSPGEPGGVRAQEAPSLTNPQGWEPRDLPKPHVDKRPGLPWGVRGSSEGMVHGRALDSIPGPVTKLVLERGAHVA